MYGTIAMMKLNKNIILNVGSAVRFYDTDGKEGHGIIIGVVEIDNQVMYKISPNWCYSEIAPHLSDVYVNVLSVVQDESILADGSVPLNEWISSTIIRLTERVSGSHQYS